MYDEIVDTIKKTILYYEKINHVDNIWGEALAGIIPANDKKINSLKELVSADHFMPDDILPGAKSVVCFFIPFGESIVKSNLGGRLASREWALAYIKTNDLIKKISEEIEHLMEKNGYKAGKIPATHNFDEVKLISNWSHRHVAYMAGMGTFGINNMLITKKGCCGRFGSIITDYEFDEYKNIPAAKENCLYKKNGSCGVCQKQCPVNAYENNVYNRRKCYEQCLENAEYHKQLGLADVCGKCLVGLPCSAKEPQ